MARNFVNLFNQINMLVGNMPKISRTPNNINSSISNTSIFTNGTQAGNNVNNGRILPQFNLQDPQIQPHNIINQQLQESLLQTQAALKELTQDDKSALIKNMLDLPEDMSNLLKMLSNKNKNLTNAEFMKLLSMLNVNGKEAAAKLSKLIVFLGTNNIKGAEKLQEMTGHTPFQVIVGALIGLLAGVIG